MKNKFMLILGIFVIIAFSFTGCSFFPYSNKPPAINSMPPLSVKVEQQYSYDVNAKDYEEDELKYTLLSYPKGMSIDNLTGAINWIPNKEQVGNHKIIINVADRWRNDTQSFTVKVSEILLTTLEVLPQSMRLTREDSNLLSFNFLTITANYDYGPSKNISLNDAIYISSDSNIATVGHTGVISGVHPGSTVVTVSYTENGITKSDTIDIIVSELPVGDT
jgi:hypothetical protein